MWLVAFTGGYMKAIIVMSLLGVGCSMTAKPLGSLVTLPKDTPQECTRLCESMGLQLSAVVVVASAAGCVCEAHPGAAKVSGGAAAASGGAVAVMAAQAAAQQLQAQTATQTQTGFPVH
jgi:hypothetical protein